MKRDYELEWSATNAHFVAGLLGFLFLVATRVYFHFDGGLLGKSTAGLACSALMLMVAVVNRGSAPGSKLRPGLSVVQLFTFYLTSFLDRASSPGSFSLFEIASVSLYIISVSGIVRAIWQNIYDNKKLKK